jgi:hypothetical protein
MSSAAAEALLSNLGRAEYFGSPKLIAWREAVPVGRLSRRACGELLSQLHLSDVPNAMDVWQFGDQAALKKPKRRFE